MHLIESYALQAGQKIDRPVILEKFYSLPFDKYITFQPFSKDAKNYSFYLEVLKLLLPILSRNNIYIVQIGAQGEPIFEGTFPTVGKTNIGHVAYLVKNSLLHFGADSVAMHLAGYYNIPLVGLYAANYVECVCPFFGDRKKQIFLQGDRMGNKPTFSFQENPKTIDTIKPESIVRAICELLNLKLDYNFETVLINQFFNAKVLETIPNQVVNVGAFGTDSIIVRMDVLFSENFLAQQSQHSKVSIVTSRPLEPKYLEVFKPQIKEIIYEITENYCLPFIKDVTSRGIKLTMLSYLPESKLNPIKLKTMEYGIVWLKEIKKQAGFPELKGIDPSRLFYKSNKFTLSEGKIFPSLAAVESRQAIPNLVCPELPIMDNDTFWREAEFFQFLKQV